MTSCGACSSQVPAQARFCPACGAGLDLSSTPTRVQKQEGRRDSSDASSAGRFVPGSVLAGRYRIIALLGRGGMGDVYRADDLRLGQPVALKFLPGLVAGDPATLARFHDEVRLARQVSHPNVCRVYDIGEAEGRTFLSMEFVDGEDLASLLRRIGRLPGDKAVEIARQLCAGLAAAHDAGVLHRDLKPANVMLDGRGRARITDFGLAVIAGEVRGADVRAGTPEYMAPEQLAGQDVMVRSDLYSLGLILFEIFTGKSAFEPSGSVERVGSIRECSTPRAPSSVREGIDPAVERVILRCLESDPHRRPASALAVAAALPGGDPLAAALAAGETPSPEMVAAAGEGGSLNPRVALACLLGSALALAGTLVLMPPLNLVNHVPMDKPPAVLVDRARELLRRLGHDTPARDSAFQFETDDAYLRYVRDHDKNPRHWDSLAAGRPAAIYFWYRESPEYFTPKDSFAVVYRQSPPQTVPGMVTVRLDMRGRLIGYDDVPPAVESTAPAASEPDWSVLFAEVGLDGAAWKAVPPTRVPRVFCDRRVAWEGTFPEMADVPVRLEAGAYHGRIVSFDLVGPWSVADDTGDSHATPGERFAANLQLGMLLSAIIGGIVLARRNLRLGRGDRSGALKIAMYFAAVHTVVWVLWVDHVPDLAKEWKFFTADTGWTLFNAAIIWLFYLGLEPYVRRLWPDTIISWSRLLAGRFRDPLIGRDILIGSVLGGFVVTMIGLSARLPGWLGWVPDAPEPRNLNAILSLPWLLGWILDTHVHGLLNVMQILFLVLLLRALLRKEWLGLGAFILLFSASTAGDYHPLVSLPMTVLTVGVFTIVLRRCGLLTGAVAVLWIFLMLQAPLTLDFTSWRAAPTLLVLVVLGGLALGGFRLAMAGRPAFRLVPEEAI